MLGDLEAKKFIMFPGDVLVKLKTSVDIGSPHAEMLESLLPLKMTAGFNAAIDNLEMMVLSPLRLGLSQSGGSFAPDGLLITDNIAEADVLEVPMV
jgi:hypothetical protein